MAKTTQAQRWWRLTLTVTLTMLFAGMLLAGMTAQAHAAGAQPMVQQDDTDDDGPGDDDRYVAYGLVVSKPAESLIGQWVIGEKTYTTTAQTEFDQEEGPLDVGACVKVQLTPDRTTVVELDSEPLGDCNKGDDDDNGDDDGREFKGTVEMTPTGSLVGLWTISGEVYTVTERTEIKQKFGRIEIGSCVKGELSSDGTYVRELQSKRDVVCKHSDDDGGDDNGAGRGELYAKLVSFPAGLIGDWVIGNITFKADANTEFDQRRGAFTADEFVKVEFVILQDGTFLAKEIKTVGVPKDDDDGPGHGHGDDDIEHHAVAFGIINSLPASGTEGLWQVGGVTYTVNITTELEARHGTFELGRNVRVKYWVDDAGTRIAKQIKSMPPAAGGNPQGVLKLVGFVDAMPADDFVGEWSVGGVILMADAASKFEEDDGFLAVGAFVEVKYRLDGSTRRILEMETHVMPGGGDDDHIGRVERMDDSLAAADADGVLASTWRIGGRDYVVTDATMLGSVAEGDTVLVNSYQDATGAQVATRIIDVTLDNLIFLPAAAK
jgi:hypothetical protein